VWIFLGATLALAAVTSARVLGGELLTRVIPEAVLAQDRGRVICDYGHADVV